MSESVLSEGIEVLKEEGPLTLTRKGSNFLLRRSIDKTYRLGSGRFCPVCGFSGRKFRPAGECPRCLARARHRLLWYYIENETDLLESDRSVLYFAPTTAIEARLEAAGNVVSTDLAMEGVDVHADITRLPFESDTFDAIVCSHVLEHIPDDRSAMSEMYRVLAPGGSALVIVPKDDEREQTYEDDSITSPEGRREAFGRAGHVRYYGRDFDQRLANCGFEVSIREYDDATVERIGLESYYELLGRTKREEMHVCDKPAESGDQI